jgi:enoyl-CoA hydratase/carnithine racemase
MFIDCSDFQPSTPSPDDLSACVHRNELDSTCLPAVSINKVPTIAAINDHYLAGGFMIMLALACDYIE